MTGGREFGGPCGRLTAGLTNRKPLRNYCPETLHFKYSTFRLLFMIAAGETELLIRRSAVTTAAVSTF